MEEEIESSSLDMISIERSSIITKGDQYIIISRKDKITIDINGLLYENIPFIKQYIWNESKQYCTEKGIGWRLPTRKELHKLSSVDFYGEWDSSWKDWFEENKDKRLKASNGNERFVHHEFLENMKVSAWFWTSEDKDENSIWVLDFNNGIYSSHSDTSSNFVLCVK